MIYIYADESGCLGFDFSKTGTKRHLLITFLIIKEWRLISSIVKKVVKTLPKKTLRKKNSYLHANYEKPVTIKRLLRGLAANDVKIATMRLDKCKILVSGNPNELYSSMFVFLINRLYTDGVIKQSDKIKFIASRRSTSNKLNDDFTKSIEHCTNEVSFDFKIVPARDDKCLQAVDFASWALWQKYENGDNTYSDIISSKIVKEYVMYQ
jgi:hypothetical protein